MADDVRSTPSSTLRIACIVLYMYKSKIGRNKRVCSAHNNKSDKRTQFLKFVHWRFCKHHIYVIHNSVKLFVWDRVCANVGWRSQRINLNKWDRKPQEIPHFLRSQIILGIVSPTGVLSHLVSPTQFSQSSAESIE
jgi:hypothetical protein